MMSSPSAVGALVFSVKAHENFKHYHQIVNNLVVSHQKWEEAERQQAEDKGLFAKFLHFMFVCLLTNLHKLSLL